MKKYIIDFNNGKKLEAEFIRLHENDTFYIIDIGNYFTKHDLDMMGATIEEKKSPIKVEGKIEWKYNNMGTLYPSGSINIEWEQLSGKKGTLTFVEDEE